ncbi:SPOR domain-containing protein [Aliifodinibius sp. S!AR15-10]|uniref:SPOR domain-containing protein n=1 Tax=Aliifodinibius sp. S!AR15-10 TaxID=2950437 RepID=UPI00285DD661|nr:SPOR domain-containing protein [Aliifodinibius sp. S!AR15-10]MDR8392050.1 SPOR domain-containing protein [Aliifodinibius sp. S!AR15-10]
MKTFSIYLLTTITLISMLSACGPSQQEQQRQQREQARQDSLEQVRQRQLQQQRLDSIAKAKKQAEADSLEAAKKKKEAQIQFDPNGPLAVQVEAWRSRDKAQGQVSKWKERGFPNAYVVKHGNAETGNIWFRVRLGRVASQTMADRLGEKLQDEYGEEYWVASVQGEGTTPEPAD